MSFAGQCINIYHPHFSFLLLGCCSLILYPECGFNQMPYGAPELVPMVFFQDPNARILVLGRFPGKQIAPPY